jgi:hypothetical protein
MCSDQKEATRIDKQFQQFVSWVHVAKYDTYPLKWSRFKASFVKISLGRNALLRLLSLYLLSQLKTMVHARWQGGTDKPVDPDSGSGALLTPRSGSGAQDNFFPDPGSPNLCLSELKSNFLGKTNTLILCHLAKTFVSVQK